MQERAGSLCAAAGEVRDQLASLVGQRRVQRPLGQLRWGHLGPVFVSAVENP